jgi:hypothetical protein
VRGSRQMLWFWSTNPAWVTGDGRTLVALVCVLAGLGLQIVGLRRFTGGPRFTSPAVERVVAQCDPGRIPPLVAPIQGIKVPTNPDLLPGAVRAYRGGVHEGVDFPCEPGVPVRAAFSGTVLWVNPEPDLPQSLRSRLLHRCRQLHRTPEAVLDALHGRRIVLCQVLPSGELLTVSYSHLGTLRTELSPGRAVRAGEVIAWTGSSGTSHAFRNERWGELHVELRVDGIALGAGLLPREAGALYAGVLTEGQ